MRRREVVSFKCIDVGAQRAAQITRQRNVRSLMPQCDRAVAQAAQTL